jgi:hypothetical protein
MFCMDTGNVDTLPGWLPNLCWHELLIMPAESWLTPLACCYDDAPEASPEVTVASSKTSFSDELGSQTWGIEVAAAPHFGCCWTQHGPPLPAFPS